MNTAKEGAIKELMLARDLIQDAALDVSEELYSGAGVGIAKACFAIAQALSEMEQAAVEVDFGHKPPGARRAREAASPAPGVLSSGGAGEIGWVPAL